MPSSLHVLAIALGSFGDVHPFLGVCRALAARGHEIELLTNPIFEDAVRHAGLSYSPIGTREEFEAGLNDPRMWTLRHGARLMSRLLIVPYTRPAYEWIEKQRRANTVVLTSAPAFGARLAQEKLGVPLATLLLQPSLIRSVESLPGLPFVPSHPSLRFLARPLFATVMRAVDAFLFDPYIAGPTNAFRAELGLAPRRRFFHDWALSPDLVIGLFPEWFGQPQRDWPAQVRCTGFPLYDEGKRRPPSPELERFLNAGDPPVVLTPGSAMKHGARFFAAGVEACERLGRRALLLSHFPDQIPKALPHTAAYFEYAPFSEVLPRSAAIVHHGGIGTCAQALAAGIPQLICPFSFDQPDNAARLERAGVARAVFPYFFTGARVAKVLRELLSSDEVRRACEEYGRRVRAASSLEETSRLIEELGEREREARAADYSPARL